tara:strand:- start:34 stop:627 length:594 start_codon:yes stop_codon:yes gene_type:complete
MFEVLFLGRCDSNVPIDLIKVERLFRNLVLAIAGSALIALCAQIYIPLYPVPITMQTFAVFLVGLTYGWRLGGITLILYLTGGALGLPVFAKGGLGLAVFVGPTAGFLFGFFFAAIACGYFAERGFDRSYYKLFISLIVGNIILYSLGLFWLGNFVGWDKPVLELGLYPFIIGDLIKIFLVVIVLPPVWKNVKRLKI